MKRILLFVGLMACVWIPSSLYAQITDATVCGILANPQSFDGKIVRVQGVVIAGFEDFAVKGSGCGQPVNAIWLAYPQGTRGKAGPAAFLRLQLGKNYAAAVTNSTRTLVTLEKDKQFKEFDKLLSTPAKVNGVCLGCVKYTITATLVGRLDASKNTGLIRDSGGKVIGIGGFGNLNRYNARLVLQSVSDISSQEIDYSKEGMPFTDQAAPGGRAFTPGPTTPDQMKRAADAFGAPGEDNGVEVGFGVANEISKNDSARSDANSPDGLVFDVMFDGDRLKGPALQIAMSHVGMHIADIRSGQSEISSLGYYGLEFRAWQTSILSAYAEKVKTLTLPGGYVIYSRTWPNSELGKNVYDGIAGFLANWAGIANPPKP